MQRIIKAVILAVVLAALVSAGIAGTFTKDTQEFYRNGTHAGTQADSHPGTVRIGTPNQGDRSLVGFWRLDSTSDPFPGSTFNVTDHSGNGHNGSSYGGVTRGVDGVRGTTAFNFDGSDDYVNATSDLGMHGGDGFTLSAWIKPVMDNDAAIMTNGGYDSGFYELAWSFRLDDGQAGDLGLQVSNSGTSIDDQVYTGDDVLSSDTWYHVAARYNTSHIAVFVDGDREATTAYSSGLHDSRFAVLIGALHGGGGINDQYTGTIDNARVYDRALAD